GAPDEARQAGRRLVPRGRRGPDLTEARDEDDRGDLGSTLGLLRPGAEGESAGGRADGAPDGDRAAGGAGTAPGHGQLAPDHARMGLRRPALDRARRGRVALLRAPRDDATARAAPPRP